MADIIPVLIQRAGAETDDGVLQVLARTLAAWAGRSPERRTDLRAAIGRCRDRAQDADVKAAITACLDK